VDKHADYNFISRYGTGTIYEKQLNCTTHSHVGKFNTNILYFAVTIHTRQGTISRNNHWMVYFR